MKLAKRAERSPPTANALEDGGFEVGRCGVRILDDKRSRVTATTHGWATRMIFLFTSFRVVFEMSKQIPNKVLASLQVVKTGLRIALLIRVMRHDRACHTCERYYTARSMTQRRQQRFKL